MPASPASFSGIFLFDKPKGITSHDGVDLLRQKLRFKKIGHGGTLDPMATGLLIMLVGAATSGQAGMQGSSKVYSGTICFGAETDTWDADGKVTNEGPPPDLSQECVKAAVEAFSGEITQRIPPYSAVRHNGQHLYKLARSGEPVPEMHRRTRVTWLSWEVKPSGLDFVIECAGGTYLRSIAFEMGRKMGSCAHLCALRRLSIGRWKVCDAVTSGALEAMTAERAAALLAPAPKGGMHA